ncbi:hypothetical protein GXM_04107 [Nostoc sphaeroides CCNUC1]|uniref:Uncharacterized protein n=1 Tax=Nostoc sphaeroides CCNUC1 TaxID=2653204 RepID=A0A5P8W2X7_9NOSO|nr:hypothetical protein GXM_04107 [Nostoc sphaeroides CCNUC1]
MHGIRDWGLGIGDWGLGMRDWVLGIEIPITYYPVPSP